MKVLVAEDNELWRKLLVTNLEKWGFDAVPTADGKAALSTLQSDNAPRLAVLDWQMPCMDGVDVCRKIKFDHERPFTYIMLLSSRDGTQDIVKGLDSGADEYLTKPIEFPVLKSRISAARRILEAMPVGDPGMPQIEGYEIDRVLGKGAFATVWRAKRIETGELVALKVIRVDLATEAVFSRFAREVRVMEQLNHPYLARVYDSHIDERTGYYAMDLVTGGNLHQYVRQEKRRPTVLINLMANVLDGLGHAHARGVIHRDLKPQNIMVTKSGIPKIVDFGMGKFLFESPAEDALQTMEGSVVGTPMYMSPEQARGEQQGLDHRTDIYSAGIVLYMLLLRKHPHNVAPQDRGKTIRQIATGKVRHPTEIKASFNPEFADILMRMLAPEREDRYDSAADLATVFREFLDRRKNKQTASDSIDSK